MQRLRSRLRSRLVRDIGLVVGLLLGLAHSGPVRGEFILEEFLYHPRGDKALEWVEIRNRGSSAADLAGLRLAGGVRFSFPSGVVLAPDGLAIACRSRAAFLAAYPEADPASVFGDYAGSLANEGEELRLEGPSAAPDERVPFGDDAPWDFLADGFGPSLERVCPTAPAALPSNWRASPLPKPGESGGSPGVPNGRTECPPPTPPARPRIYLSEVHYHPVLEESLEDVHEFLELHNAGVDSVSLQGWRLAGDVAFEFPEGTTIAAGAYLVVAKDRAACAGVWSLPSEEVLGDWSGALDNGGGEVALVGADGRGVDFVRYDDDHPWPAAADAFGAGASWLGPELLPLSAHRYKGCSLERVSFDFPSTELANWAASPVDGATPGRANSAARPLPLPVVSRIVVHALGREAGLIRAEEEVVVEARFTPVGPDGNVAIESFVEDVTGGRSPPPTMLPMHDDGISGGDARAGDAVFTATLPGQPNDSIVRYRIRADRGSGDERVSPRLDDPNEWHAWFVDPPIQTTTRTYQLFISPANWGRMWTNIQGGRVSGCTLREGWDDHVPAVFIHEGRVFDARVRYQGSRYNRMNGPAIPTWPWPRPSTGPLLALSWRIEIPRYSDLEGRRVFILNKLTQECPGYNAHVGYRLFDAADLPWCETKFIRFHVNGGYYRYMLEIEQPGEEQMRRYHDGLARRGVEAAGEPVGHLFKSMGCNCDEGPFGWGDERALAAACGYTKLQRYAATYERKSHEWDGHEELMSVIEDLNTARRGGNAAIRAFLEERFDLEKLLDYVAIMNWSVPFDDMFQNHFLYQRRSDGKWLVWAWDLDQNFGEWQGAQSSLYMGQSGDPSNRSAWWNYLKDSVLRAYRTEYEDRLLLLTNTILHPDRVAALVDETTALANPQEAAASPGGFPCSFPARAASFKAFATARFNFINTQLAGADVDAGPDQTVFAGQTVHFDASASKPEPGPGVDYRWDNGMEGARPTQAFDEVGVHQVTLTVTARGIPFRDTVAITVIAAPLGAFLEVDGSVAFEAEHFSENLRRDSQNTWWETDSTPAGFSGDGLAIAREAKRQTFLTKYASTAPELRFAVLFANPGEYRVWVRGFAPTTTAESCYVGLDGVERPTTQAQQSVVDPAAYLWSGSTRSGASQVLAVGTPGLRLFSVWIRRSGFSIDKVILSKDPSFVPEGLGPEESPLVPPDGTGRLFRRGDASLDGRWNITDAVLVLRHLFGGSPLACASAGDADDSGTLDITDAIRILSWLFGRGDAPSPPFPEPGIDPTPDGLSCETDG